MPTFPTGVPTLLEWIQEQALDSLEDLQWALTKDYYVIYDNEGAPVCVFGSSAGAQSHPLFGSGTSPHPNGRYQEWSGPQEEFLGVPFVEGMWDHEKWEPGETLLPHQIKLDHQIKDLLEKRASHRGDNL